MQKLTTLLRCALRKKRAVSSMEYGLIAALISVTIIAAALSLGSKVAKPFNDIANVVTY